MEIVLIKSDGDYEMVDRRVCKSDESEEWGYRITMTTEKARALRDQITKHLRGAKRDKEDQDG